MLTDTYKNRNFVPSRAVCLLCALLIVVSAGTGLAQVPLSTRVILTLSSPGSVANTGVETLSAQVYDAF